jgi:hypothetical protein
MFAAGVIYGLAISAVVGVGVVAIGDFNGASAKQRRELDAAIDQIVDQHNERKALIARSGPPVAAMAAAETTGSLARRGKTADTVSHAEERHSTLALDQGPIEPPKATAKGRKREARARGHRHFLPFSFASLPKFTAYTLFGLR